MRLSCGKGSHVYNSLLQAPDQGAGFGGGSSMMTAAQEEERWQWPRYNPPGLLIGPLPYKRSPRGDWVPDYSAPGVKQRKAVEIDFHEDQYRRR